MYELTLARTVAEAGDGAFFQRLALSPMLAWFCKTTGVEMRGTLRETIEAIPSAELSYIDCHLVRSIVAPASAEARTYYQALTALNGLVFARVVEVSQPNLAQRARQLREGILDFYEPAYAMVVEMLAMAARRSSTALVAHEPNTLVAAEYSPPTRHDAADAAILETSSNPSGGQEQVAATADATFRASPRKITTAKAVVIGVVTTIIVKAAFIAMRPPTYYSNSYATPNTYSRYDPPPTENAKPVAPTLAPVPNFVTTITKAVTAAREYDAEVPATVFRRQDLTELIGKRTCLEVRTAQAEFRNMRILHEQPISFAMFGELMAVEFFACNPGATTWSSNQ